MSDVKVTTNNHNRELFYGDQLTKTERAEFDYLTDEELSEQQFFRFRGDVWSMGDFVRIHDGISAPDVTHSLAKWDGVATQSHWDAIVIRYGRDWSGELDSSSIVVGHATW